MAFSAVVAFLVPHLENSLLEPNLNKVMVSLTVPLANCCSAAKTAPPHLGQPWPGGALIEVVSGL